MILNDSDKLFLVNMEDTLAIEKFSQIFKCKEKDVMNEYDRLLDTGEYYYYQAIKLKTRGVR